jgi:hypothetical protein
MRFCLLVSLLRLALFPCAVAPLCLSSLCGCASRDDAATERPAVAPAQPVSARVLAAGRIELRYVLPEQEVAAKSTATQWSLGVPVKGELAEARRRSAAPAKMTGLLRRIDPPPYFELQIVARLTFTSPRTTELPIICLLRCSLRSWASCYLLRLGTALWLVSLYRHQRIDQTSLSNAAPESAPGQVTTRQPASNNEPLISWKDHGARLDTKRHVGSFERSDPAGRETT